MDRSGCVASQPDSGIITQLGVALPSRPEGRPIVMPANIENYSAADDQIWQEELASFVPLRIFDAHVHLLDRQHVPAGQATTWTNTDMLGLQRWANRLYPGREVHFLVLGTPIVGIDVANHNRWLANEVQRDSRSRVHRLVTPHCDIDEIRRSITTQGFTGLKPYRLFSSTGDVAQCRIRDFLPPAQLELANELELWVTLHLSRFHGCADEQNLADLTQYTTQRYPRIKWILAHCARSFTYWPIQQAIDRLRDLPNIWYDTSAVTDVRPLITLFSREDRSRILYGSDGVDATYFHGQYVALGRSWQALDVDSLQPTLAFPHCDGRPILAIYEQLLAMKHAAEIVGLSATEIDAIFYDNAARAFAPSPPTDGGLREVTDNA